MDCTGRLLRNARIIVETACGARPGETVLILTEKTSKAPYREELLPYARAMAQACLDLDAHPLILDIGEYVHSSAFSEGVVLEPLHAAMRAADVVINAVDYANFSRLAGESSNAAGAWKSDKYIQAQQRWFALQSYRMADWNITAEQVADIRRRTDYVLALAQASNSLHIATPAGSDFTVGLGEGALITAFRVLVPLYGEVPIVPKHGTENGVLIVDGTTQKGVRPVDELDRPPLRIAVADGVVTDYDGDPEQVARLRAFIEDGEPRADNIDEVGIVTSTIRENDLYWWEDGTHCTERTHVALGNNADRTGAVHGRSHMDCELCKPTISIDGTVIIKDGVFVDANLAPV